MPETISQPAAALLPVCMACCGDPQLTYRCPRCSGTGTEPYVRICGARHRGYICTRPAGHDGEHQADDRDTIVHTWRAR